MTLGDIVVGVDGSGHGRRALAWAVEEAALRGSRCIAVYAWDYAEATTDSYVSPAAQDEATTTARALLSAEVGGVGVPRRGDVQIEERIEPGPAARVLVAASQVASLLVVGSHGRGGVASALLGSVSLDCVHHAACPVVVVPPQDRAGHDRE